MIRSSVLVQFGNAERQYANVQTFAIEETGDGKFAVLVIPKNGSVMDECSVHETRESAHKAIGKYFAILFGAKFSSQKKN